MVTLSKAIIFTVLCTDLLQHSAGKNLRSVPIVRRLNLPGGPKAAEASSDDLTVIPPTPSTLDEPSSDDPVTNSTSSDDVPATESSDNIPLIPYAGKGPKAAEASSDDVPAPGAPSSDDLTPEILNTTALGPYSINATASSHDIPVPAILVGMDDD